MELVLCCLLTHYSVKMLIDTGIAAGKRNYEDLCEHGVVVCGEGDQAVCDEDPALGIVESCNAFDDDCDGVTDEDFAPGGTITLSLIHI